MGTKAAMSKQDAKSYFKTRGLEIVVCNFISVNYGEDSKFGTWPPVSSALKAALMFVIVREAARRTSKCSDTFLIGCERKAMMSIGRMGTVTGISDRFLVRWKNSQWCSLQIGWDESTASKCPN
ncbi:auxin response factor 19-like protein isoform X2 [Tanacetum coccineum]